MFDEKRISTTLQILELRCQRISIREMFKKINVLTDSSNAPYEMSHREAHVLKPYAIIQASVAPLSNRAFAILHSEKGETMVILDELNDLQERIAANEEALGITGGAIFYSSEGNLHPFLPLDEFERISIPEGFEILADLREAPGTLTISDFYCNPFEI